MADSLQISAARHVIGVVLAVLLGVVCYGLYLYVPVWIRGTVLQSFGNLVIFVVIIAVLSLSERFWVYVTLRLKPPAA